MTTPTPYVSIIGLGNDGLDAAPESVRELVLSADLIAGDQRTMALVPDTQVERLVLGADPEQLVARIEHKKIGRVAVLVSGDPLFYGLARFLCDRLGADCCEIVPHVSSMQLAFARVKESWDEAYLTNLANHPIDVVVERIRSAEKVGLFTNDQWTPAKVAAELVTRQIDYFTAYVCENLGARNERVTCGTLSELSQMEFESLNVMILVRAADAPDRPRDFAGHSQFGNPDEMFVQSKPKHGLLTPAEVRSVALSQMSLHSRSVVWDVGAGCGSVSVESALLAPGGKIFAIEQDLEDHQLIQQNAERFGVTNVTPVLGKAPEIWHDLPDPDAVFIEGSGREIARLADLALDRIQPGGRLVANVVSIDSLHEVRKAIVQKTSKVQVWMIHVARGTDQLQRLHFDSLNPTFLVATLRG
jgi:precorrin-6B C5,15-methyltransferase / cobalt-precorrin-6B C5,C15-methyltransferase